jgi:hypothetical protein
MADPTPERTAEVERVIQAIASWTRSAGLTSAVVGSWARGSPSMTSDIDVVILTDQPQCFIDGEDWWDFLGPADLIRTQHWGAVTERRVALPSGVEVEFAIAEPAWAGTNPVDPGTQQVVRDGLLILNDPQGALRALMAKLRDVAQ